MPDDIARGTGRTTDYRRYRAERLTLVRRLDAEGLTRAQIAQRAGMAERTLSDYVRQLGLQRPARWWKRRRP